MRIKTADFVFEIKNIYPYCEQFMTDYLTDEKADCVIEIDLNLLKEHHASLSSTYPIHYIELLEIYRKICDFIVSEGGIMMHGAVIGYKGAAYMFTAPSGTGKTTHIKQWKALFGDDVIIINGDKPIIRYINGKFVVYGTPWCGKEHFNTNIKAPLKGIVLLSRGEENIITPIDSDKVNINLLKQVYMPKNSQGALSTLDFANRMFSSVPLYSLQCNISLDAARVAEQKITEPK